MKIQNIFLALFLTFCFNSFAQNTKEVLFTIDNNSYKIDEFKRIYLKNLDLVKDDSQKDLNQYLDLFIGYKLKVIPITESRYYNIKLEERSIQLEQVNIISKEKWN